MERKRRKTLFIQDHLFSQQLRLQQPISYISLQKTRTESFEKPHLYERKENSFGRKFKKEFSHHIGEIVVIAFHYYYCEGILLLHHCDYRDNNLCFGLVLGTFFVIFPNKWYNTRPKCKILCLNLTFPTLLCNHNDTIKEHFHNDYNEIQ